MQGRVYCTRLSFQHFELFSSLLYHFDFFEGVCDRALARRSVSDPDPPTAGRKSGIKISRNETAQAGRAFTRLKIGRLEMIDVAKVRYPPA